MGDGMFFNPYTFEEFLMKRERLDFFGDDPFAQQAFKYFSGDQWRYIEEEAPSFSNKVSTRWRKLVEQMALPENKPSLLHYDGYGNRIDRIVRPLEAEVLEKEVFSEALFSERTRPWLRLLKMFLLYQLGEASLACPLVCTEGLIALLEKFADSDPLKRILLHCKEGIGGDFGIGAQYLSEIQGGSDVPSNRVEAVFDDGLWKIYGDKFFCSAAHADYAVVTAKPKNSPYIAAFVVPSWEPFDGKAREKRNNLTINRLKRKMGTVELPTAEISFRGSLAYSVGPLERGLSNVVGIVLSYSRMTVGLSSAAFMVRAAREAKLYASFRRAFGSLLKDFPLVDRQLENIEKAAERSLAGALKLYKLLFDLPDGFYGGLSKHPSDKWWRQRFVVRELLMLQKVTAAKEAPEVIRQAVSIFGGHGVMEDFSDLPRLFRDSIVNELWEGPRNVLLTQIHRDFQKVRDFYGPALFLEDLLGAEKGGSKLVREMEALLSGEVSAEWDGFCDVLTRLYQTRAYEEVCSGLE